MAALRRNSDKVPPLSTFNPVPQSSVPELGQIAHSDWLLEAMLDSVAALGEFHGSGNAVGGIRRLGRQP